MRVLPVFAFFLIGAGPICGERPQPASALETATQGSALVAFIDVYGAKVGSGILIDRANRLVLTAYHVIMPEDHAPVTKLRFDGSQDKGDKTFTVVWSTPQAGPDGERTGSSWAEARDLALLQVSEPLPADLVAADLGADANEDDQVFVSGFPDGGSAKMLHGTVNTPVTELTRENEEELARCTRTLDQVTAGGMSGSAVLTGKGRLIGVTIGNRGSTSAAVFVRSACFFDQVIEHAPVDVDWLVNRMGTDTQAALGKLLARSPNQASIDQPITNIMLYRAGEKLVGQIAVTPPGRSRLKDNFYCIVERVADARNLPTASWSMAVERGSGNRETADLMLQQVLSSTTPNPGKAALAMSLLMNSLPVDIASRQFTAEQTAATFSATDVVTLKSIADLAFKLSGGDEGSPYLPLARKAATLTILADKSRMATGGGYAVLGDVFLALGQYARAVAAFGAAELNNFTTSWVSSKKFAAAKRQREAGAEVAADIDLDGFATIAVQPVQPPPTG